MKRDVLLVGTTEVGKHLLGRKENQTTTTEYKIKLNLKQLTYLVNAKKFTLFIIKEASTSTPSTTEKCKPFVIAHIHISTRILLLTLCTNFNRKEKNNKNKKRIPFFYILRVLNLITIHKT